MTAPLPPRVGINAIFLEPHMGGLVTYVEELVPELLRASPETRFAVFCAPIGKDHLRRLPWASEVHFITHPAFGIRGLKALTEMTALGVIAGRRVDLLHSVALTAPLGTRAANVVTIADTTWMFGDRPDPTTRLWRATVPTIARRADRIIAISEAGAREIEMHLRIPPSRIDVTILGHAVGVRGEATPEPNLRVRHRLGNGPLILMVGTRKPHKNPVALLRAMPSVLSAVPHATLVFAGNPTGHEGDLIDESARLGIDAHVRFLPFVSSTDLDGLYAAAEAFVLPSRSEGFGLPVLEAMSRGLPVICSEIPALAEVAGGAARLIDPDRPDDLAAALVDVLGSEAERHRLAAAGRRRAAALSWRATAEATLESYARAWAARRTPTARAFPSG